MCRILEDGLRRSGFLCILEGRLKEFKGQIIFICLKIFILF